jgi:hypothetical protein
LKRLFEWRLFFHSPLLPKPAALNKRLMISGKEVVLLDFEKIFSLSR